jgi:hypothetical protein
MDQPVRIRRVLIVADDDFAGGIPGGCHAMALGRGCGWAGREL